MAEWITVLCLVLFGLTMLLVELLLIPGVTLVGLLGLISATLGVVLSFEYFGPDTGLFVLSGSLLTSFAAIYASFRKGTWKKLMLTQVLLGKVNDEEMPVVIGDEGVTVSALRPAGSAKFEHHIYEVRTHGQFLDAKQRVKVVAVEGKKIIVAPA